MKRLTLRNLKWLFGALRRAFRTPTPKQMEVYARYCHTLSAAALIAGAAIPFTESQPLVSTVLRTAIAMAGALLLFVSGALLLEER